MKKTILAVDDSRTVLNMLELYLREDYQPFCTTSGEEALRILQKQKIDLILLDILMPVMDGMTLLKKIRRQKEYEDIPVLFLTNDAHRATVVESFQTGSQGYVLKPVAKEELLRRIQEAIEKQEERIQQRKMEEENRAREENNKKREDQKDIEAEMESETKKVQTAKEESLSHVFEDADRVLESFVLTEDDKTSEL